MSGNTQQRNTLSKWLRMQILCRSTLVLLTVLFFVSCNRSTPVSSDQVGSGQVSSFLNGTVVDNQGNPLDGVAFHYIPNLVPSGLKEDRMEKVCDTIMITFSLSKRTYVNLSVYRWFTRDLVATIVNDTLDAGLYSEGSNISLTNGVYVYDITMDTSVFEHRMILIQDTTLLPSTVPLAVTNSSGQFSVPIGVFGIGVQFGVASSKGPEYVDTNRVASTIQAVLCKTGYKTLVTLLTIDTTKSLNQKFILER